MTWLTVPDVATLCRVTDSAVKKAVQQNKYQYRYVNGKGRGGKQLRIALESLPEYAQARYRGEVPPPVDILQFTGKQRDEANAKAWVVEQYQQKGLSPDDFVSWFNSHNPAEDAITKSKLFRWQRKYQERDVAALIDQRGGHNRGKDTIPEEAWELFYSLYMTQQKRGVKLCYDVTRMEYPDIPSCKAFERKVKTIPYYAVLYYRDGPKAFNDALPSMERSKLDIASNDIWFSDHHLVDVFVKSADGARAIRPWLTVFFDARSNRVVSFLVRDADPNATAVKKCFRLGVEQNGVPNEVYFDNGKDYRSKSFSKDYPMSLVNQLGIGQIYATPYHGQAKTVERFFGTLTNRFSRRFDTYTGCNAKIRPECMQISNKEIVAQAPTLDEFIKLLSAYIAEYNQTANGGVDMDGKCPDQVYAENLAVKRVVSDLNALRLLCGNSEERVVHKNGISIKNNNYYNDALLYHQGERVIVVYDPDNIDKIAVFDMENRAICMAEAKIRTPFRHTSEEDYIRAAKEKKKARAMVQRYKPTRDVDIHEIIARNQLMEKVFSESGEPDIVEHITPQAARNAATLKATDRAETARRIREEDSVSATLLDFYQKQA
ncbi:Mu transposase C-terminal domain-containing protein [Acutalibacter muris]|uniref:Mu transposase C-terminal domain-containing protein n=2 Tax=Eubacteriales TaxID=186802 RepID=UPI00260F0EEA|nr:Mu transposase C-terminal domain-containing protein [Acutalibacter muris]MCX4372373.1 Mu transposase C-terminal domain-containing protein [Dysosmobacter sp.]